MRKLNTVHSRYPVLLLLKNPHKKPQSLPVRVRQGGGFCGSKFDRNFTSVIVVLSALLCYIGPRYIDSLYIVIWDLKIDKTTLFYPMICLSMPQFWASWGSGEKFSYLGTHSPAFVTTSATASVQDGQYHTRSSTSKTGRQDGSFQGHGCYCVMKLTNSDLTWHPSGYTTQ